MTWPSLVGAGWKLIYDPRVAVDHYPAQRFDEDQRNKFNQIAQSEYNGNPDFRALTACKTCCIHCDSWKQMPQVSYSCYDSKERALAGAEWHTSLHGRLQVGGPGNSLR